MNVCWCVRVRVRVCVCVYEYMLVCGSVHECGLSVYECECERVSQFSQLFIYLFYTYSETVAQFLKTLNTNLRRVNHFVKTTQILLKTFFPLNSKHSYQINFS